MSVYLWKDAMARWVPCSDRGMAPPGGMISARVLGFKPLNAARKNFDHGMRAMNQGLNAKALEYFSETIRMDRGYVEPHV